MPFQVLPKVSVHPTEELLEEYSFGRVSEPQLTPLEEHLLICVPCQIALADLDDYAAMMKEIMGSWESQRQQSRTGPFARLGIPRIPMRSAVLAASLMAVFVSAAILISPMPVWHSQRLPSSATVQLAAMRGGLSDGLAHGPSGRPLDLAIDGANLPPGPGYRLILVNEAGHELWRGNAVVSGTKLSAHVPDNLGPGIYWLRLYSSGTDLVREYGMRLQ